MTVHIALTGNESSTESPHDSGDIRTNGLAAGNLLEASKHRIIVKRTSLHHDMVSKLGGVGYLNHFKQGIFYDRIGKAGGNVRNLGPLFLGLLDL